MKNLILICALIASTATLSAQNWNSKKTKGNGKIITQDRTIGTFNKLKVAGHFKVSITSEQEDNLTIKTDENLMDHIITEVEDGTLVIKMKKNHYLKPSNHKAIALKIPLQELRFMALSGSGSIRSEEAIKTENLDIKMSGSGKVKVNLEASQVEAVLSGSGRIELQGTSTDFEAKLSGSGAIKAKELKSNNGDFNISGSGRIEAQITEELNARVSGSGSVRYLAKPSTRVHSKVSGSGSIKEIQGY